MLPREETFTYHAGLVVNYSQMKLAFENLGLIVGVSPVRVATFWSGFVSNLRAQPLGRRVVQYKRDSQGWPFAGVEMLAYSTDVKGVYLLHIFDGLSGSRRLERHVAARQDLPRAVSTMNMAIALPVENDQFRCDMAPFVDTLRDAGFTYVRPQLSAMTGEAAANAVGALLPPILPGRHIVTQDLSQWCPEWGFEAGELRVVITLGAGYPPVVKDGVAVHRFTVDGSVVASELSQDSNDAVSPRLQVRIERNEPADTPHPLMLSTGTLRTRAQELSHAFANINLS